MNLSNKLTILRILIIPIFLLNFNFLKFYGFINFFGISIKIVNLIGCFLFFIACITDYFDGFFARKFNEITFLGEFLDPLADKLIIIVAFIILLEQKKISSFIVSIIICREILITGFRGFLFKKNIKIITNFFAKVKTFLQMLLIILLFIDVNYFLVNIVLYLMLFFTIYSAINYIIKNKKVFKK